ncbi:helix-turn-helix transcriptional regulator [Elioraea sp.]|uniref:helix-turn-helix transcriptional regulator n=1 Tax=Elioraea sp. TaxID=2185103 RepID=UPI0025C3FD40|nr:helix-turn-helix transcriptional regulator [Elioraea sp.]
MDDAGPPARPRAIDALLPTLTDLVQGLSCRAGAILQRSDEGVSFRLSVGLSAEAIETYLTWWQRRDPWLAALRLPSQGRAWRGEDLVGPRLLRGSAFNTRWLAPHGLGSIGIAEIGDADDGGDILCVWRAADARSLSRPEVHLLRAFAATLALLLRRDDISAGTLAAGELVAHSSVPVAILHDDCTVLWSNAAASRLWACEAPFRRACGRLTLRAASQAPRFQKAVADIAQPGARPALLGFQTDAGIIAVRLQPLVLSSSVPVVALTASLPDAAVPSPAAIAATLGLTRAQAEVASLLCRGLETAAISERIGVSQHTLNGHLRDLYGRLHAANRVQAVVRVLGAASTLALLAPGANGTGSGNGNAPDSYTPK